MDWLLFVSVAVIMVITIFVCRGLWRAKKNFEVTNEQLKVQTQQINQITKDIQKLR